MNSGDSRLEETTLALEPISPELVLIDPEMAVRIPMKMPRDEARRETPQLDRGESARVDYAGRAGPLLFAIVLCTTGLLTALALARSLDERVGTVPAGNKSDVHGF